MKILHYFLGFPPYRSGGLTRFSFDLMKAQIADGNDVSALWPGKIGFVDHRLIIKKRSSIDGIRNYELVNPLPVPLDEGIIDIDAYTASCDENVYDVFLEQIKPDVIHIHTLMGLHKEFIDMAQKHGIRIVFTTHDYFGICPKVYFYRNGDVCDDDHDCRECVACNKTALTLRKIKLLQSHLYSKLKNSPIIKRLRSKHRAGYFEANEDIAYDKVDEIDAQKYIKLREYYVNMLNRIDIIHFNSNLSASIYLKFIRPRSYKVISISNSSIKERPQVGVQHNTIHDKLSILYLAPVKPYKGFHILKKALDELWDEGKRDFELKIFAPTNDISPYMVVSKNGYNANELSSIFSFADILVAPSVWYETFGFTVLEAISFGVPVIVSDRVGAKDIIGKGGIVVKANSVAELKEAISGITEEKLKQLKFNIKNMIIESWDDCVQKIYNIY